MIAVKLVQSNVRSDTLNQSQTGLLIIVGRHPNATQLQSTTMVILLVLHHIIDPILKNDSNNNAVE